MARPTRAEKIHYATSKFRWDLKPPNINFYPGKIKNSTWIPEFPICKQFPKEKRREKTQARAGVDSICKNEWHNLDNDKEQCTKCTCENCQCMRTGRKEYNFTVDDKRRYLCNSDVCRRDCYCHGLTGDGNTTAYSSSCAFAYYTGFSEHTDAEIHFVQPNLLSSYYKIPKKYRGPNDELWNMFVTCSFYHELGHHLVEIYSKTLKHLISPKKYSEIINAFTFDHEQKLCEYLGFYLMHCNTYFLREIILPSKYTHGAGLDKKHKNGKECLYDSLKAPKKTKIFGKWKGVHTINIDSPITSYLKDIGNSDIYMSLNEDLIHPSTWHDRNASNENISNLSPTGVRKHSSISFHHSLSAIGKAKGGRGWGSEYFPTITSISKDFITAYPGLWNHLFHYIFCCKDTPTAGKYAVPKEWKIYYNKMITRDKIFTDYGNDKIKSKQSQISKIIKHRRQMDLHRDEYWKLDDEVSRLRNALT